MNSLFLNLASHDGLIACVGADSVTALLPVDHRLGDEKLLPAVEEVLQKAGIAYADLTQIACILGPGGFTSLRMGVTLANVLADQLRVPSVGIHLSDLYAARFAAQNQEVRIKNKESKEPLHSKFITHNSFLWMHSTKRDQLFVRTYKGVWTEPTLITLEELKNADLSTMQWGGELIPAHREIVDAKNIPVADLLPIEKVLPAFVAAQRAEKQLLMPWYGRGW